MKLITYRSISPANVTRQTPRKN